jgi:hypothetical protein
MWLFQVPENFLDRLAEGGPMIRSFVTQFVNVQEDGVNVVKQSIDFGLLGPLQSDSESVDSQLFVRSVDEDMN